MSGQLGPKVSLGINPNSPNTHLRIVMMDKSVGIAVLNDSADGYLKAKAFKLEANDTITQGSLTTLASGGFADGIDAKKLTANRILVTVGDGSTSQRLQIIEVNLTTLVISIVANNLFGGGNQSYGALAVHSETLATLYTSIAGSLSATPVTISGNTITLGVNSGQIAPSTSFLSSEYIDSSRGLICYRDSVGQFSGKSTRINGTGSGATISDSGAVTLYASSFQSISDTIRVRDGRYMLTGIRDSNNYTRWFVIDCGATGIPAIAINNNGTLGFGTPHDSFGIALINENLFAMVRKQSANLLYNSANLSDPTPITVTDNNDNISIDTTSVADSGVIDYVQSNACILYEAGNLARIAFIKFNQPPTKPTVKYNNVELSQDSGNPTDIPTTSPSFLLEATDPDAGDTLEYKLAVWDIDAGAYVDTGTYQSDGNISPSGLESNKNYRLEPWAKDNNGAETQGDNYYIFTQLRYQIQISQPITASAGDQMFKIGFTANINGNTATLTSYDQVNNIYTFEISGVDNDKINVEVSGKEGFVLDNLLFAIS